MDIEILNEKKRNREEKPEALASPENVTKKKKKKKRKVKQNEAETEQQNQQPSQVCPKPLVVVTTPISLEETPKKKKIKKKKSNLIGEQQELNKNKEEENGEVPNETNALAIEVPTNVELKTEEQIQYPEPLVVPISVEANLVDPKDIPKKNRRGQKKKKHKNKSDLNGEQQELNKEEVPNETNPPKPSLAFEVSTDLEKKTETLDRNKSQTEPHTPIPVSLIPQTSTLQPAIPIETEQKLSKSEKKRKRKRKRKNKNVCPKQCSPIEQTVAVDPAISMDEPAPQIGQTIPMNKHQRKRMNKKKNNKILDGAQPNGHNIKQPETLVQNQTSICHTTTPPIYQTTNPHTAIPICPKPAALIDQTSSVVDSALSIGPEPAPLIGQTFPVDPAIPIDTQQKLSMDNRKQRRMAKKSLLSEEQPNGRDPKSTAKAPVRETIGVTVTKDPRSQICWACRKSDHKISQCRMLKSLSKHAEVCFFCGEIGHSLGRCSVSSAGGGRLAKCLLCHADGHFSYNCPGDGHGNYLEPEGEFIADVKNL